jgi:hypothetical protein
MEQTAHFPEFIEKWTKIGLSTEPADRPRAEAAVKLMYKTGGLPSPEKVIWFGSPMTMCAGFKKTNTESVYNIIIGTIRGPVSGAIGGTVADIVRNAVGGAIWDAVGGITRDARRIIPHQIYDQVYNGIGNIVSNSVRINVWSKIRNLFTASGMNDAVYGFHESYWLSLYDYFREVLGLVKETDKLTGLFELAKSCGWIIPCEKICFVSERHNILNLDSIGKLHCEDGPAIVYPDGWSVCADHGIVVPEKVVTNPDGFTVDQLKLMHGEIVRVVIRKIGFDKFMAIPGTTSDTWTRLLNQIAKETINE